MYYLCNRFVEIVLEMPKVLVDKTESQDMSLPMSVGFIDMCWLQSAFLASKSLSKITPPLHLRN